MRVTKRFLEAPLAEVFDYYEDDEEAIRDSNRVLAKLENLGYLRIEDISHLTMADLLKVRGLGKAMVERFMDALKRMHNRLVKDAAPSYLYDTVRATSPRKALRLSRYRLGMSVKVVAIEVIEEKEGRYRIYPIVEP